ncbi:MAG TPA: SCO family protein [Devosiaceae bacterium]|jgi:protein SCO1/2|nr:SCO family protein [Devosiaceae bacterium]
MTTSRPLRLLRNLAWGLAAMMVVAVGAIWMQGRAGAPVEARPYAAPFTLLNQDGEPVTERDFLGKPSAWFYGFTHCPDVCPTALAEMSMMLSELGPDAGACR